VTLVVPYAAGGGTDTVARLIGERMSRALGQTVVIENVVGGGSTLANDRVARSAPDGSTVLINHVALLAAPSLFTNLRYDTKTAFEPVGLVNNAPMVLIGRKSIPGQGPKDFVAWIKAQGDKANFAHGGVGTNSHLCAVMMGNVLGFKPTVAAYRGSAPAIADLLAGQIDLLWDQVTNALPQIQAGTLHGIAITSSERLEQLKDVPTTAELGMPDVSYTMWHGLYVAKGTPKETIGALNSALRKALSDPGLLEKLKQLGTLPFPDNEMTPEAHARLFATDLPRSLKARESRRAKRSKPRRARYSHDLRTVSCAWLDPGARRPRQARPRRRGDRIAMPDRRFRANRTFSRHRRMTEFDPERTSAATPATAPRLICQPPGPSVMM
jgi:tripartite-type tricarboxylate transporter receptor subunit TctC